MNTQKDTVGYLLLCSQVSLESFHLGQLNRAANLEKELRQIAREWAEHLALAYFAELLRFRREIIGKDFQQLAGRREGSSRAARGVRMVKRKANRSRHQST